MSFTSLLIHTVVVFNPIAGATGRYGDEVPTYDGGTSVSARVQELDPLAGAEETGGRDTRITRFRIYLQSTVTISGLSYITWSGRKLLVEGEPLQVDDGDNAHHIEAFAKEMLG